LETAEGQITSKRAGARTATSSSEIVVDPAERRATLGRVAEFHKARVGKLLSSMPQIPVLDGGQLVMHLAPLQTFETAQPEAFAKIAANYNRFPPIVDTRPRDHRLSYDGLSTGSNAEGLGKPQRAYVYVFRSGVLEAVCSSLARGEDHKALQLPNIQSMIVHYARVYATALREFGVKNMRLLQDFIGTAFIEDLPYGALTSEVLTFGEVVFNEVPIDDSASAKMLYPILCHMANAAQLPTPPYFDGDGNYSLKPAQPAG
jgi:hypothetical protein